jgi:hypothetical protein
MEPQLIQAMGELSLADKAKARASKAYGAMTEEQKAERRASQAAAAKAKRAAKKDEPKAEVPVEVAETKKEKDKLRKQKARAEAKAEAEAKKAEGPARVLPPLWYLVGTKADMNYYEEWKPELLADFKRVTIGGVLYYVNEANQHIYRTAPLPDVHLRPPPEDYKQHPEHKDYWVHTETGQWRSKDRIAYCRPFTKDYQVVKFTLAGIKFALDLSSGCIWEGWTHAGAPAPTQYDPRRVHIGTALAGMWGEHPFTFANVDDPEMVRYKLEEEAQRVQDAQELAKIAREEAEEEARPGREAAEMARADREFARERRRALAPKVRAMAIASLKSLEGSYLGSPESLRARLKPDAELGKEQMEQFINEGSWYDPARGFRRDEFGNPVEADWRKYSRDTQPINPETRPGIDVSLTLARMFGDVPAEPAKPLAPKAKTEGPVNVDALTPTHKKHIKSIAKEVGAGLPLTGKGDLTAAFMREVRAYFNAMTPAEWGKAGIDDHIRAFFSHRSK